MLVRLENPTYSYTGNNIVGISATVTIYDTVVLSDGSTQEVILYETTVSSQQNLTNPGWYTSVVGDLTEKAQSVVNKYKGIISLVRQRWPDITTPDEAIRRLVQDVESKIVV